MSATITPTLFLGPPEDAVWLSNVVVVADAAEALDAIGRGNRALLPEDAWGEAVMVLDKLGLNEQEIQQRIRFARTGEM